MKKKEKPQTQRAQEKTVSLANVRLKDIDYKNISLLKSFLSSRFKILSSEITGVSAKKQRVVKREVKKARIMGLLPFTDRHVLKA